MKRKEREETNEARRDFLRAGAAAGAGVAALAVAPGEAAAEAAGESEREEPRGYRLTEHVMAYYQSAAD